MFEKWKALENSERATYDQLSKEDQKARRIAKQALEKANDLIVCSISMQNGVSNHVHLESHDVLYFHLMAAN